MEKYVKNAPLEKGDTVVCIKMQDEYGVPGGVPGVVKSVANVMGDMQYYVEYFNFIITEIDFKKNTKF